MAKSAKKPQPATNDTPAEYGGAKKMAVASVVVEESWFWVSALYKSVPVGKSELAARRRNLWERRVFVIRVLRGDERRVARRVAKQHEKKYVTPKGENAVWRLQEIEAYAELFDQKIESGTEGYWNFFVKVDPE